MEPTHVGCYEPRLPISGKRCYSQPMNRILRRAAILLVALATACWLRRLQQELTRFMTRSEVVTWQRSRRCSKPHPDLISSKDTHGLTPLHCAALLGHKDVAELLLANKAEVNARDTFGGTPLQIAAYHGYKDVAELLLANKADVNGKDNNRVRRLCTWRR